MRLASIAFVAGLLFVVAGATGCKNKLKASLKVDDANFYPDSCRSGQALGFSGVELRGSDGTRLRLVATPAGTSQVFYFEKGSTTGQALGDCGPFQLSRQNSTINNITNVEGNATLKCEGGGHKVEGTVTFGNCH